MRLVDTHAHLNLVPQGERQAIITRALAAGVDTIIIVGIDLYTSTVAVELAAEHDGIFAVVGIHPHGAKDTTDEVFAKLEQLACQDKVVAIGETGLDFYRDLSPRDMQKEVFCRHIELAARMNKPLIVHDRQAHGEVLDILAQQGAKDVLMHCFSGDVHMAMTCVERGYMVSAAGPVTFHNAGMLRDALKEVPLSQLVIETDSPYLAPHPYRGKKNEPAFITLINDALAKVKSVTAEEMARTTFGNAMRFLSLDR